MSAAKPISPISGGAPARSDNDAGSGERSLSQGKTGPPLPILSVEEVDGNDQVQSIEAVASADLMSKSADQVVDYLM